MANQTNNAYTAKSPMVFRPTRNSANPRRPVALADLEPIAAATVLGAAVAGPPVALTLGDSLALSGTTLNLSDGSKGNIELSAGGTVMGIGDGQVTEAMQVLADNTTQDATVAKHGYLPKLSGNGAHVLHGDGTWS